jgi:hypothetical protein
LANKHKVADIVSAGSGTTPSEAERAHRDRTGRQRKKTTRAKIKMAVAQMRADGRLPPADLADVIHDA